MLNWSIRYNKLLQSNPELFDHRKSVLEVGCGSMGGALYLKRPVTGLEFRAIEPSTEWLTIVQGNILNIPFPDGAFDFVLCIDVLEHLTIGERPLAIKELWRVARERVLISCPCHNWALRGEQELADFFRSVGQQVPEWLVEHLDRDFPKIGHIVDCITDLNMPIEFCGNETMMQHYGGIFVDFFLPYADELQHTRQWKAPLGLPIGGSEWDLFYSYLFTLKKGHCIREIKDFMLSRNFMRSVITRQRFLEIWVTSNLFSPERPPTLRPKARSPISHNMNRDY